MAETDYPGIEHAERRLRSGAWARLRSDADRKGGPGAWHRIVDVVSSEAVMECNRRWPALLLEAAPDRKTGEVCGACMGQIP
jgi:hypothetical protein